MSGATVLIAGPTASGKSGLALALAESLGGTVINADSMQVYDGLRILTARPDEGDEARAPHRLYGVLDPSESCSAGRWVEMARTEIASAHAAGRLAVVVGGTGLYFHALTEGLSDMPAIDPSVRARLIAEWEKVGARALHARLATLDPALAARLKPGDSQRILRGLEVVEGTGRPLSAFQAEAPPPPPPIGVIARYAVAPPRELLLSRIRRRLEAMAGEGAVEEARAVAALGLDPALPVAKAIGLRPFAAHAAGEIDLATAIDRAEIETRQYAKRQMTWVRGRMADWPRLDGAQETERIISEIEQKIRFPGLTTQS
ncbi:MAG: tRNA (adenosine(37)-N6)-dimethylallyltransferase MiaA [Zavarzinia sp.]|nr:tRNA (adenosine(37)-N6)-dimethylallyltransferase MiaA [Zavarzinia sp.]